MISVCFHWVKISKVQDILILDSQANVTAKFVFVVVEVDN